VTKKTGKNWERPKETKKFEAKRRKLKATEKIQQNLKKIERI
jgi:hypothetical protein